MHSIPIAFKESRNADALGMVAPKRGMDAIDLFEPVGEPRWGQIIWSKPSAQKGEGSHDRRKGDSDQCGSCQRAGLAEALPLGFCWFEFIRHLPLQTNEKRKP